MESAGAVRGAVQLPDLRSRVRPTETYLTGGLLAAGYIALALLNGGYGPMVYSAAGLIVWWAVIVGLVFGVLPRGPVPSGAVAVGGSLAALVGLTALSAAWASDDGRTFLEAVRAAFYLGIVVLVVLAARAGSARAWLGGLAVGLLGTALLALGSRMVPGLFPESELIRFLSSASSRLSYPLDYWNGLGAAMAACAVLLAWLAASADRAVARALSAGALPLPLLVLFLASSRGAVLALAVGLLALLVLSPARARFVASLVPAALGTTALVALALSREEFADGTRGPGAGSQGAEMLAAAALVVAVLALIRLVLDRPLERLRVGPGAQRGIVAAAVVVALAGIFALDPVQRIESFTEPPGKVNPQRGFAARHLTSVEGNGRYQFWSTALDALADQPAGGLGAGGYEAWWAREGSFDYRVRDAHSFVFETAAELGVAGLVALAALALALAAAVRGRVRDSADRPAVAACTAVLATTAVAVAIDWSGELPAVPLPGLVAAGLLAGGAFGARRAIGRSFGWGLVTLLAAWVAVFAGVVALTGEARLAASRDAAGNGDLAGAADGARDAASILRWSGEPYLQLGLVEERRGRLGASLVALAEAVDRSPEDWRAWLALARVRTVAGDVPGARSALGRARELNPRSPLLEVGR